MRQHPHRHRPSPPDRPSGIVTKAEPGQERRVSHSCPGISRTTYGSRQRVNYHPFIVNTYDVTAGDEVVGVPDRPEIVPGSSVDVSEMLLRYEILT